MRLSRRKKIGLSIVPWGTGIPESSRSYLERISELVACHAISRESVRL